MKQEEESSQSQTLSGMVTSGSTGTSRVKLAWAAAKEDRASVGDGGTARCNPQDERVSGGLKGVLARLLDLPGGELFRMIVGYV